MKTFVVLGMHRSATSLVAQGLAKSDPGVHVGDNLLGPAGDNPWGFWEDRDFLTLNDYILKTAGGAWNNPPTENAIIEVGKNNEKEIEEFIKSKQRSPFWGWKDPRTTLTIKCYLPYLENPHFICCYRKPEDIAESLHKRNGMPIKEGIRLADIYNNRLRKFIDEWTGR